MIKYFIKSISIEGFRGINNDSNPLLIDFQSDGVTSIFGENGKGKSSIFEAFLFSILGRIVRFDDYHLDIKDRTTIKNLFHQQEGKIKIEFIDNSNSIKDINITVGANGERTISSNSIANPEVFLTSLCSTLNFLDYKSFEKIILKSAEETGKLFANLVGFGNFIHIKEKLDKISRTQNLNSDFGKSTKEGVIINNNQRIAELKTEIQQRLAEIDVITDPNDSIDLIKTIKSFLQKQYSVKIKKVSKEPPIDFDELLKTKIGASYEENALKLNNLQEALREIDPLRKRINKFNSLTVKGLRNKLQKGYSKITTGNEILLGKLYDDAIKSYDEINSFNKNTCILCNTENLGSGQNTFYNQINNKTRSYTKFKEQYSLFFNQFREKIQSSGLIEFESKYIAEPDKLFTNVERTNEYLSSDFFEAQNITDILSFYKERIKNEILQLKTSIKQLKTLIPPNISRLVEINSAYNFAFKSILDIDDLLKENNYNSKYLAELENWIDFSNQLKEDYEEAYNILMEEIALMIDSDTKLFFKDIMGDVDIIPKLKKEHRGQKVNILLEKFHSKTTDSKAAPLLSESYRNALSLSIYFAAALKSKNPGNFIIVDDITSSFDSGHQLYLLDLIKRKISISPSNKKGKQIIFLTHDGLLKKVLNENNSLKNWKHYNLNANQDAVSLRPISSDDLKIVIHNKITSGNYVGSDFRMYYEKVLLEIIEKLNLEIPFSLIINNDEKMVGKLSKAIEEIIEMKRMSRRIRGITLPNKNDFKVHTQQLSNNLSHWASGSVVSLAAAVLNRIADDIDTFKKLFQYNCTCSTRNAGWVYYKSLTSPKQKGCTCII